MSAENNVTSSNEQNYVFEYNRNYTYNDEHYSEEFNFTMNVSLLEEGNWYKNYNIIIINPQNATIVNNLISNYSVDTSNVSTNLIAQLTLPHNLIYQHPPSYEIINRIFNSFFIDNDQEWVDNFKRDLNNHWRDTVNPEQQSFNPLEYTLYSFEQYFETGWYGPGEQPDHALFKSEFGTHTYIKI